MIHSSGHAEARPAQGVVPPPRQHPLLATSSQQHQPPKQGHPLLSSTPLTFAAPPAAKSARTHRRCHSSPSKSSSPVAGERTKKDTSNELMISLISRKKKYGECHPQVGLCHNLIGNYHFRRGDLSAAASSYNAALRCFENFADESGTSGSDNSEFDMKHRLDVAVALGNIGAVLWRTGKLKEAIRTLEKGLRIREHVYAIKGRSKEDCVEMANTLYSLGLARSLRCEYEEAMASLTRARNTLLAVYGPSHVEVARIEDAQGKCFLIQGNADKAMEYHRTALKTKIEILGPRHTSVLSTKMNIAAVHRMRRELDEAIAMYREVLSAQKLALYREIEQETRRQVTADIDMTLRMISEAQREKSNLKEGMAAIIEEKKEDTREVIENVIS